MGQSFSRAEQSRAEQSRAEQSRAEQSRLVWLDICRGIGILFVILGHCNTPFNRVIYGFHMALFFILSGWVWRRQDFLVALKKNFRRYITPYFVLCGMNLMLWMLVCFVFDKERYSVLHYIIGILYSRGTTEWLPNCSPLWYLTALFVALLIVNATFRLNNSIAIYLAVLGCFICGILLDYFDFVKLPWNIDTALIAVVFICLGIRLRCMNIVETKWLIPVLGLVGLAAIYFNPIYVSFDNNEYGNPLLMLMGAIGVSLAVIIFSYQLGNSKFILNPYLAWLGRHTVFIMGFDYFSGTFSSTVLEKLGLCNFLTVFVLKIAILSLGCVIWNKAVDYAPVTWRAHLRY